MPEGLLRVGFARLRINLQASPNRHHTGELACFAPLQRNPTGARPVQTQPTRPCTAATTTTTTTKFGFIAITLPGTKEGNPCLNQPAIHAQQRKKKQIKSKHIWREHTPGSRKAIKYSNMTGPAKTDIAVTRLQLYGGGVKVRVSCLRWTQRGRRGSTTPQTHKQVPDEEGNPETPPGHLPKHAEERRLVAAKWE